MRCAVALLTGVLVVGVADTAGAKPPSASRCAAAKLMAAGRGAHLMLACRAKAGRRRLNVPTSCLERASARVARVFAKTERRRSCLAVGDASAVAAQLEVLAAALDTLLRPAPAGSRCAAAKLKVTGKRAATLLAGLARGRKRQRSTDVGDALLAFEARLAGAFAKREALGACDTVGDAAAAVAAVQAFAGAVLLGVDGCTPIGAGDLEQLGPGLWAATLAHARGLGYTDVLRATLCPGLGNGPPTRAAVTLGRAGTAAAAESVELVFLAEPTPFTLLVRIDEDRTVTLFTEGGGVRIPPNASPELVGPDGATPAAPAGVTPAGDGADDSCAAREARYRGCLLASDALSLAGCAAAVLSAVATVGTLTTVAAIACTQAILPGPLGIACEGLWDALGTCDRGSRCSLRDRCMWGTCRPGLPANTGARCADELPGNLPLCLPEDPPAIVYVRCSPAGICGAEFGRCPGGETCRGQPGAADCCDDGDFQCSDGTCIAPLRVCDGDVHCPGGDDESPVLCRQPSGSTTTSTTRPGATSTTRTDGGSCILALGPACGGSCPPGQICGALSHDRTDCECVDPDITCLISEAPACGGACPAGLTCRADPFGPGCQCL